MNSMERELIVEKLKKQIRKNNWDYLCRHPEIRAFVRVVLNEAVKEKPTEIYEFTANLFRCDNFADVSERVNNQIKRLKNLKDSTWTEYDGNMFFTESSESPHSPIETILKFSGVHRDEYTVENSKNISLPNSSLSSKEL